MPAVQPSHLKSPAHQARALRESLRLASELADALTTQAARVKRQCTQLEDTLAGLGDLPEAIAAAPAAPSTSTPATDAAPEESPARLVAMEMAIQGATREQIESYLRNNLNISDAQPIVDDVLPG